MNGADVLRIVDLMHREKNIPKDVIFEGIEAALQLAIEKHYGDEEDIAVEHDVEEAQVREAQEQQRGRRAAEHGHAQFHVNERPGKLPLQESRQPRARAQRRKVDADDD